ncbi:uncharacterized protein LOC113794034 [Dermatophagoides pteronyssinus]|uniref:uncharacterized protein LOC113794034 n=1 Tax=Dermatophagoides pteronyssinus TaxID=6956 RepID=UPI003F66CBF8
MIFFVIFFSGCLTMFPLAENLQIINLDDVNATKTKLPDEQFPPHVWIPIEQISASIGSNITLNCLIEANPLSLNYWTFGSKSINVNNNKNNSNSSSNESKYKISINKTANDKHNLRLSIQSLSFEDVGHYQCHANNSLGHQMKQVEVHAHNDQEQQQRKSKWKISDHIHVPSLTKRKEDSSITFDPLTIDNDQSEQPKEKKIKLKWGQVPFKNTLPKRRKGQMDEDKYKDRGDVNYKLRNKNKRPQPIDDDKYKDRGDVNYKLRNKNRPKH